MNKSTKQQVSGIGLIAVGLLVALAVGPVFAEMRIAGTVVDDNQVVGSGDGRIHVIPSLSAPSIKNGD